MQRYLGQQGFERVFDCSLGPCVLPIEVYLEEASNGKCRALVWSIVVVLRLSGLGLLFCLYYLEIDK